MNRWFCILLAGLFCLAISALGCDRGGGQIASEIILRSPLADSEWPVSILTGIFIIDGTYLINGVPAPAGTEIAVSVFLHANGGVSSRYFDPSYVIAGNDGKFYIEIQPFMWSWPPGQYTVQVVDGDYLYESPEFKMVKTEIILRSPLPESIWNVGEELVVDGTYLIDDAPAPKGEQIGITVFQYPEGGGVSSRGSGLATIGDGGTLYLEILTNNWQADRYIVQCTTEDGLLYYESPRFNIVGESH